MNPNNYAGTAGGQPQAPPDTNSTDGAFLRINVTIGSPIFVIIRWEVLGASAQVMNNIKYFAIEITDIHSTTSAVLPGDFPSFKLTVPGNTTQYIFGPIGDGTDVLSVQFTIRVDEVFNTELALGEPIEADTTTIILPSTLYIANSYI